MEKENQSVKELLLLTDLNILHSRLRDAGAALLDITCRYPNDMLLETVAGTELLEQILKRTEYVYDWTVALRKELTKSKVA
jgi:hypothetical protein